MYRSRIDLTVKLFFAALAPPHIPRYCGACGYRRAWIDRGGDWVLQFPAARRTGSIVGEHRGGGVSRYRHWHGVFRWRDLSAVASQLHALGGAVAVMGCAGGMGLLGTIQTKELPAATRHCGGRYGVALVSRLDHELRHRTPLALHQCATGAELGLHCGRVCLGDVADDAHRGDMDPATGRCQGRVGSRWRFFSCFTEYLKLVRYVVSRTARWRTRNP